MKEYGCGVGWTWKEIDMESLDESIVTAPRGKGCGDLQRWGGGGGSLNDMKCRYQMRLGQIGSVVVICRLIDKACESRLITKWNGTFAVQFHVKRATPLLVCST